MHTHTLIHIEGSAQKYLSGGQNCYGVRYIRVYFKGISEKCKNSTGQISEGTGQLSHCQPVWAEPCTYAAPHCTIIYYTNIYTHTHTRTLVHYTISTYPHTHIHALLHY